MDFFSTQQQQKQKYPPPAAASNNTNNNNKKRLTQAQVRLLERSFASNKKLEPELKLRLANQLSVPPRQVAIWYQNKRARWKTQTMELEYNKLQVKLENAMADKRRLERQVLQLQDELRKNKDVLFSLNPPNYAAAAVAAAPLNVSCSSSCDDEGGGSSSCLHEDVNGGAVCDQVLQLDELYACLIGGAVSEPSCWV